MNGSAYGADAPCSCHEHAVSGSDFGEGDMISSPHEQDFQEGAWQHVALGADVPGIKARGTLQRADEHGRPTPEGPFLHAFLKFRLPRDPKVYMVRAHVDLREIENAIERELEARQPGVTSAVSGGKIWRKLKRGVKKAVKAIAKNKIVAAVVKVAKKVWNNPLVKGIVSATPWGAAINATAAAARVAAKAIKGATKAKNVLSKIARGARAGNPADIKAARLVKAGMKMTGILPSTPAVQAAAAGNDEGEYLAAVLGACVDCQPMRVSVPYAVGCGADEGTDDVSPNEVDALETIATSGAFEGVRWAANRLGLHSMAGRPDEFSKRDALLMGLALYAPRH